MSLRENGDIYMCVSFTIGKRMYKWNEGQTIAFIIGHLKGPTFST